MIRKIFFLSFFLLILFAEYRYKQLPQPSSAQSCSCSGFVFCERAGGNNGWYRVACSGDSQTCGGGCNGSDIPIGDSCNYECGGGNGEPSPPPSGPTLPPGVNCGDICGEATDTDGDGNLEPPAEPLWEDESLCGGYPFSCSGWNYWSGNDYKKICWASWPTCGEPPQNNQFSIKGQAVCLEDGRPISNQPIEIKTLSGAVSEAVYTDAAGNFVYESEQNKNLHSISYNGDLTVGTISLNTLKSSLCSSLTATEYTNCAINNQSESQDFDFGFTNCSDPCPQAQVADFDCATQTFSWTSSDGSSDRNYYIRLDHAPQPGWQSGQDSQCTLNGGGEVPWFCVNTSPTNAVCNTPDANYNAHYGFCHDQFLVANGSNYSNGRYSINMPETMVGEYKWSIQDTQSQNTCDGNGQGTIVVGNISCGNAPCQTPPTLTSPANAQTRINKDSDVVFNWNYAQESHPLCTDFNQILVIAEKTDPTNLSDTSDCNFASPVSTQTITDETLHSFNLSSNEIDWGKAYCWRVEVDFNNPRNANVLKSEIRTFRTNLPPKFLRMGAQFALQPILYPEGEIGSGVGPVLGTQNCESAITNSNCDTSYASDGSFGIVDPNDSGVCWTGGSSSNNNMVTFWFDYEDLDNEGLPANDYEYLRHFLVLNYQDMNNLQKTLVVNNLDSIQITPTGGLYLANLSTNYQNINNNSKFTVDARKYQDANGKIRIYYRINFKDEFATKKYYIYSLLEDKVYNSTSILGDSYENVTYLSRFTKQGKWGIDVDKPEGSINAPVIIDTNHFEINWGSITESSNPNQSGLNEVNIFCKSDGSSTFDIKLDSYRSNGNSQTIGENLNVHIPPGPYNSCLGANASTIEELNAALRDNSDLFTTYSISDPNNYNDLVLELNSAKDNACNISSPQELALSVNKGWIETHQGSVYSRNGANESLPFNINSHFNIYSGTTEATLQYFDISDNFRHLSTNFLGSNGTQNVSSSATNSQISEYNDLNVSPSSFGLPQSNWYEYFTQILQNNGREISRPAGSLTNLSSIADCSDGECFIEYSSSQIIDNFVCSAKAIIFVNSDLTIRGKISNPNSASACIFLVKGNITIEKSGNPLDLSATFSSSPYDFIDAFLISEQTITIQADEQITNGQKFIDALMINGGLVAKNTIEQSRDLGLRNNAQPSVFILYDPKYIYFFNESLFQSDLKIRSN